MSAAAEGGIPARRALALGIVQGPAELLPVSSSAHIVLIPWLAGWDWEAIDPEVRKSFEVALHTGTAAAIQDKRQAVLNAACAANPRRFTRRPRAPKMPAVAWINKPVADSDITQHPSLEAA